MKQGAVDPGVYRPVLHFNILGLTFCRRAFYEK